MNPLHRRILSGLLSCPTAPFSELQVVAHLHRWAETLGLEVKEDRYGNVLVHFRRGRRAGSFRPWVLTAHMDHPGFVADRQRGSLVWGAFFGGVAEKYFLGAKMVWHTPDGPVGGVIESARRSAVRGSRAVRVRLARRGAVPAGTPGMWDLPALRIRARKLHSRACDDMVGLAMAMAAVEESAAAGRAGELYILATRGEEAGFVGAMGAVRSGIIPPNATILSIETSSVKGRAVRQGKGIVIRVGDRTTTFDPHATQTLCDVAGELAEKNRPFRWQRALMQGGTCEASVFCQYGLAATAACLALGNYHNQGATGIAAENVHLDDFADGVKLLATLANRSADADGKQLRKRFDALWNERKALLKQ